MKEVIFRKSNENELEEIISVIKEFATCVRGSDITKINKEAMREALFHSNRAEHRFIEVDGKIAGYIVFFYLFSTFKGRVGIYLEDIYVRKEYRAMGIGSKAFDYLNNIIKENNYCRLEWNCLNTNLPAMKFYRNKIKAEDMNELTFFTLENQN